MKQNNRVLYIKQTNELIRKEKSKRDIILFVPDYIYHEEKNKLPIPKRIEKLRDPNSKFIGLVF